MLNLTILSRWQNWARVLLIVAIGMIAFDLCARGFTLKGSENG